MGDKERRESKEQMGGKEEEMRRRWKEKRRRWEKKRKISSREEMGRRNMAMIINTCQKSNYSVGSVVVFLLTVQFFLSL